MGRFTLCLTVAVCTLLLQPGARATEHLRGSNPTLPQNRTLDDDLVAFGGNVLIQGTVNGDVTAAGSTITISGPVTGDLTVAGANVSLESPVSDDVRAAGANVTVRGPVADNAALAGNMVTLVPSSSVGRDVDVAAASLSTSSRIGGDLRAACSDARIGGEITGNVEVRGARVELLPGAVIHGNLTAYTSQAPIVPADARVEGEVVHQAPSPAGGTADRNPFLGWLFGWLFNFGWMLLLGSVLIALSPVVMERVANKADRRPWISAIVGFAFVVLTPIVAVFLMFTLIGIPLSLLLMAVWFTLLIVAQVYVAFEAGGWVMGRLRPQGASPYARLAVGALLVSFVISLPWIGWVVLLAALCVGLGAAILERGDMLRTLRARRLA